MAKVGRPKAEIARNERVVIRLTAEEHEMVHKLAKERHITISELLLEGIAAIRELEQIRAGYPAKERTAYEKLVQIRKILDQDSGQVKNDETDANIDPAEPDELAETDEPDEADNVFGSYDNDASD